jgi:hypothetical protein
MTRRNLTTTAAGDPLPTGSAITAPGKLLLRRSIQPYPQGRRCLDLGLQLPTATDGEHRNIVEVGIINQASEAPHQEPVLVDHCQHWPDAREADHRRVPLQH